MLCCVVHACQRAKLTTVKLAEVPLHFFVFVRLYKTRNLDSDRSIGSQIICNATAQKPLRTGAPDKHLTCGLRLFGKYACCNVIAALRAFAPLQSRVATCTSIQVWSTFTNGLAVWVIALALLGQDLSQQADLLFVTYRRRWRYGPING